MSGNALALVAYVVFLVGIVWRLGARPERDGVEYFLAGRRLTLAPFVATLVTSWYGGVLGVGEFGYRYGVSNWLVFGVPYYVSALLFAFLVARRARETAFVSIPDALRRTYGDRAARLGGLIVFIMTAPASYVLMLATLFTLVLGVPKSVGVLAGGLFTMGYVLRGGLWAVVRTDVFQFVLMFASFLAAAAYLVVAHGVEPLRTLPDTHWTWHGGNGAAYVIVWFFIALATLIEPVFYQRVFAAESSRTARRGVLVSVGFWMLFDFLSTGVALYARALLPEIDPISAYPRLAQDVFPPLLSALFFVGMLAVVMSTLDSYSFIGASTLANLLARETTETSRAAVVRLRYGLAGTAVWCVALAFLSDSVVELWHDLGSIGTPALLLPMLGALYEPLRIRRSWIEGWIVLPAVAASLWLFAKPPEGYWLGIEPIYAGLAVSLLVRAVSSLRPGVRRDAV
jgi:SSS family solute:Na+ symporter